MTKNRQERDRRTVWGVVRDNPGLTITELSPLVRARLEELDRDYNNLHQTFVVKSGEYRSKGLRDVLRTLLRHGEVTCTNESWHWRRWFVEER